MAGAALRGGSTSCADDGIAFTTGTFRFDEEAIAHNFGRGRFNGT